MELEPILCTQQIFNKLHETVRHYSLWSCIRKETDMHPLKPETDPDLYQWLRIRTCTQTFLFPE
jgi:hypothetical protein